ncbi:thiamine ABC transporter substrate-binding protein [Hyperthermus butylicus]|uniref:Thiamine-binding, periplasmic protein n=1 Tax=Hyperthermus butylicus (strain DSM 5456 / JCM 9403 / PLM1-5) TaxID=415426 RepID=A2BJN7_HYPBU|nr:thiamine ABC transporter substrate-binding protein [Hyperthermus butylicus]ABM80198.1 Thiamine-binding, periplasmic protein [Hyperthermus butylicus DSM 5456]
MTGRAVYFLAGVLAILLVAALAVYVSYQRSGVGEGTSNSKTNLTSTNNSYPNTLEEPSPGTTVNSRPIRQAITPKPVKLVVYTYDDFMAWGEDEELFDKLVQRFENETGIDVVIYRFDGARQMVTQVLNELDQGVETADVVIGIDPILLQELKKHNAVVCYLSPSAPLEVANALDPDHCATPIDYGLIALVYDPSRLTEEELAMLRDGVTLDELVKLAPRIVGEDPTKSSTGLNFLLYTMALSRLEGRDWKELWRQLVGNGMMIAPSWGSAYDEFLREGSPRAIVVSYGTDPAYSAWYSAKEGGAEEPSVNATVLAAGGKRLGWMQVEGVAIIRGAELDAAKKFVDWLLSEEVQREIPASQWMFPAVDVSLPSFYKYALTAKDVDGMANSVLPPDEIYESLEVWLKDWLSIAGG